MRGEFPVRQRKKRIRSFRPVFVRRTKKAAPFRKMSAGMNAMTISFVMDFSLE